MTAIPPPEALVAKTYKANDKVGMGKTASWSYPFCIIRRDWTCTQLQTTDPITGASITVLTTPLDGVDADYFWTAWSANVDYGDKETTPWCGWTVSYNGLYYQPSIWLSSAQRGVNPAEALCEVGQEANWRYQYGVNFSPKKVLKNQSHPIRAWECKGSYVEYNQWDDMIYFWNAYNPETNEYRVPFIPHSFSEHFPNPEEIGGNGYGYCEEGYFPNTYQLREWKVKNNPTPLDPDRTTREPDSGSPALTEPIGWDPVSGAMPTKSILEKNPYTLTGTTGGLGESLFSFITEGCSARLWYQKYKDREYKQRVSKQDNWYQLRQRAEVASTPMPESKYQIINYQGWWELPYISYYIWSGAFKQGSTTSTPTLYANDGKFSLFVTVTHPVALTRKVKTWSVTRQESETYQRVRYGPGPNDFYWEVSDFTETYSWQSIPLTFAQQNEPLNIGGYDAQNKFYDENPKHAIYQFSYRYSSRTNANNPNYEITDYYWSGDQQWLDD